MNIPSTTKKRVERKPSILVCSLSSANNDPRPNRVISQLTLSCEVSFLGFESTVHNKKFYPITTSRSFLKKICIFFNKLIRDFDAVDRLLFDIPPGLELTDYTHIFCHSPELLPYLVHSGVGKKIILDAREYYPRNFENDWKWRLIHAPYQYFLCQKYFSKVRERVTVSEGLAKEYKRVFNVDFSVMYSLPLYFPCTPVKTVEPIRLIYHGIATPARKLEEMIYSMDAVSGSISLDLMLAGSSKYTDKIKSLASGRSNVKVIDPVAYSDIIKKLRGYDVGVIFFPASTFNLQHCMPNKLFELIQANVAIICSPLEDLSEFVRSNGIGCVTDSFYADSLSRLISNLDKKFIDGCKENCNKIAREYSQDSNANMVETFLARNVGEV